MRLPNALHALLALLTLGAALSFTSPALAADTDALGQPVGNHKVIDLLPLIDPKKDTIQGKFAMVNGELVSKGEGQQRIEIRYSPPEEYDYRIEFTNEDFKDCVIQMLSKNGTPFIWVIATGGGKEFLFHYLKGTNNTSVKLPQPVKGGIRHVSLVRVRNGGAAAYFDGTLMREWKTDYTNIDPNAPFWSTRNHFFLGLGCGTSKVVFHSAEVIEITGHGKVVERDARSPTALPARRQPPAAPAPRLADAVPPTPQPIDISITCAKPDPNAPAPKPPADPNAIERPDYMDRPKPLLKNLTSATAMMVNITPDGDFLGLTSDIIATVDPDSRRSDQAGIGILRDDGDATMKTALEEAVRAIRLRYPIWAPGHINISFGEKFVAHGGPSAGTAFALLMLSSLEGFDLDPKCAITGDITVDWKVRPVGGVTAKLHGATLDKCLYAAIPADNETSFADIALLYGDSALWDIQVFSIATLQDAQAIARKDRPEKLAQAIKLFADLQPQLAKSGKLALQKPETQKTLAHILELAPNHLSAKYLLAIAQGKAPRTLSMNATLYRLDVILSPYERMLESGRKLDRTSLPVSVTANARKQFAALRPITPKEILPLLIDESAFIESMNEFAESPNPAYATTVKSRAAALDARFDELAGDKDLRDKLRREGY